MKIIISQPAGIDENFIFNSSAYFITDVKWLYIETGQAHITTKLSGVN
jgi:hypothetical protein